MSTYPKKYIKDKGGNKVLPITHTSAVRDSNGVSLDEILVDLGTGDKDYDPTVYSGLGKVVLPKNMVGGVNTLTQDMFYKGEVGSRVPNTNTIFIINYDFVLGESITIPEGSILEFDGGSISNSTGNTYTITGQNTVISNPSNSGIFNNIFIGTSPYQFINDFIIVDWFRQDSDSDKIQNAILFSKYSRNGIKFLTRQYVLDKTVVVDSMGCYLQGSSNGGEYGNIGSHITVSENFVSDYTDNPLFYFCGEKPTETETLGVQSSKIEGIEFLNCPNNDICQFKYAGYPARPLYVSYCKFINVKKALRILENNSSTNLGFVYIEHNTFQNNDWNLFVQGRHGIMGLVFSKNVAEQCSGCINLGYTDTHSASDAQTPVPVKTNISACDTSLYITDNLLEGTVDFLYVYGGPFFLEVKRNYFERGGTNNKQFICMYSDTSSSFICENNFISRSGTLQIYNNGGSWQSFSIQTFNIRLDDIHGIGMGALLPHRFYDGSYTKTYKVGNTSPLGTVAFSGGTYDINDGINLYHEIVHTTGTETSFNSMTNVNLSAGTLVIIFFKNIYKGKRQSFQCLVQFRIRRSSDNTWTGYVNIGSFEILSGNNTFYYTIPEDCNIIDIRCVVRSAIPSATSWVQRPGFIIIPTSSGLTSDDFYNQMFEYDGNT